MSNHDYKNYKSDKMSFLQHPHLTEDLPNSKFKIVIPSNISNSENVNQENINQTNVDFDIEKYYQNLNIYQHNLNNKKSDKTINEEFININENFVQSQSNNNLISNTENNYSSNLTSYFGLNKIANYFSISNSLEKNQNYSNESTLQNIYQIQNNQKENNHYINYQNNVLESTYSYPKPNWFYKVEYNNKNCDNNKKSDFLFFKNYSNNCNLNIQQSQFTDDEDENWLPFSIHDSNLLENAYQNLVNNPDIIVSTNGDKYDCYIKDRCRKSIYWEEKNTPIRRCYWYYKKEGNNKFIPYNEDFALYLEKLYYDVIINNKWNERIELNKNYQELVIFNSPTSIIHYKFSENSIKDEWNISNENLVKLRFLNRGLSIDELKIFDVLLDNDEAYPVNHLVFFVHGVGDICDMKFRSIKEVVDDFRKMSLILTRTHFRNQNKTIGRTEYLPIFWHNILHGNQTGIDSRLNLITLSSIPKLRSFLNDTVLDALFYTSPVYCQKIINTVANEINRLYDLFLKRNPYFKGHVSLSGHSLGSVILFDLLANQEKKNFEINNYKTDLNLKIENSNSIVYSFNNVDAGQINISYPKLNFKTSCFFALGSPISMFLTLRGICTIDEKFHLPDCTNVFNIFHPFDPIAYRIEPLINKEYANIRPIVLPHHKGRKRMHLQIKENILKISSDFKDKFITGIKTTWESVNNIFGLQKKNISNVEDYQSNKKFSEISENSFENLNEKTFDFNKNSTVKEFDETNPKNLIFPGLLNNGKRIDYVLQEKPIEFFNQYIFALAAHACYWVSEDTCLFMLKELYKFNSIHTDSDKNVKNFDSNLSLNQSFFEN